MENASILGKKNKKYTGPRLTVWDSEPEPQPSAADILFGDMKPQKPQMAKSEAGGEQKQRSAADVLFGDFEPQKPLGTMEDRGEEKRDFKTINASVHNPRQSEQKLTPLNSAGGANSVKPQQTQRVVAESPAYNDPKKAIEKTPEQTNLAVQPAKETAQSRQAEEGNFGSWKFPMPEEFQDEKYKDISKYHPLLSTIRIIDSLAWLDQDIMDAIPRYAEGVAWNAAASKNALAKIVRKPAKFVSKAGGAAWLPVIEIANGTLKNAAATDLPYSQETIDDAPEAIQKLQQDYAKLVEEKETFLKKLEGYRNGDLSKHQLPSYFYLDRVELQKTEAGRKFMAMMERLPSTGIDGSRYMSVYTDEYVEGFLSDPASVDWVGFASQQMQLEPGDGEAMTNIPKSIKVMQEEYAGNTKLKELYQEEMLKAIEPKNEQQKALAKQIIEKSPENPYTAWKAMYDQARIDKDADKIRDLENMRRRIEKVSKSSEHKPE